MIFLNLGCGGNRPKDRKWLNIDDLHKIFPDAECPERVQMDSEFNYRNCDIRKGLNFDDGIINGIVASHLLEHLDVQECIRLLKECYRVLKVGGVIRVSVPSPELFERLTSENCIDWGEPNPCPDLTFMEYALFFVEHKQLLTKSALKCLFRVSGFIRYVEMPYSMSSVKGLEELDNRPKFSLFMEAVK